MSRRVHRRRAFRRPPTMSFRARLFAFLALTGVLPVALLGNDGKLLAPAVYEPDAQKPDAFSDADLQALLRHAPLALAEQAGTALGLPYRGSTGTTRLPVALRLDRVRFLAAEMSLK